ncbi:ankyrin repeat domain-containing protein 53 isoform X2 [Trachinotus anak]
MACLYGQLAAIQLLAESTSGWINSSDPQGRRPIHMVMSSRSSPNTSACLRYLLENGTDVNVTTDSGQTPLHLAASEGLLDCTKILVQAGADVLAQDSMGHTPLDFARIWCRREIARYLKSCMWKAQKKKEMEERKLVQALYSDLVDMVKLNNLKRRTLTDEKIAEWANKKGFPHLRDFSPKILVSQYHTQCLLSDQNSSNLKLPKGLSKHHPKAPPEDQAITSSKPPRASASKPWTIYMGLQPEKPPTVPDLRDIVTVWRDSRSRQPQYTTKWDSTPRAAPHLPLDILKRVLFPRAFPSRIVSPRHFEPQDIVEVQQRGCPQGRSTSPWTEVAMHLAEVLEPGHY